MGSLRPIGSYLWFSIMPVVAALTFSAGCQSYQRKPAEAEVKIVGGEDAGQRFPAVQMIHVAGKMCSGTFVDKKHFLTAAHCLRAESGQKHDVADVKLETDSEQAVELDIHPSYGNPPRVDHYFDVGIVTFNEDGNRAIAVISRASPRLGDWITIVGFGRTSTSGFSLFDLFPRRRFGKNRITKFIGPTIYIENFSSGQTAGQALLGQGDSGGGWFDSRGELIAVGTSGNENESEAVLIGAQRIIEFIRAVQGRSIAPRQDASPQSATGTEEGTPQ